MNLKKALPVLFFVILALVAIALRRCNNEMPSGPGTNTTRSQTPASSPGSRQKLDRDTDNLFFTKHAKCRMQCRHITQQEVKDILRNGTVNYSKSDLNDPKGATYALEGITKDRQHVRVIFAPKQRHLSVVTVIDLDNDYVCNC